ncbi:unnamed protein product [Rangifer tarandus platyrhynchus]|uniref:Uncharacterized protein n=1 Tax=Rangifer tarandus platyrhynchus TaxID=3082113 RepID=A0AC59YVY9_RANTA
MAGAPSLVSLLLLTPFNPLSLSHPGDHLRLKTQPSPFLTCSNLPRTSHCTHSIHSPSRAHDALRDLVPASCHHVTPSCSHYGSLCSSSRASFLSFLCSRLRNFAHAGPPPRMLVPDTCMAASSLSQADSSPSVPPGNLKAYGTLVFPGSLKYYPGPTLLSFRDQTRLRTFRVVWP